MARKQLRAQTVRRGKESVLRRNAREGFQRFLRKIVITLVSGERVHADERDNRHGICAGRGRVLERFTVNVQPPKRRGIGRTIKESAAFDVGVILQKVIERALCGAEITRVQGCLVGIQQSDYAEYLVIQ